jgi:uncharacterized repeat protein (TIGR01451 family)
MKKLIPLIICLASAFSSFAQTASFTVTTAPCHNDGVLTANFTGLTPPLTVSWTTYGTTGTTYTHTGVSALTDALTSYSGGPISLTATDGTGTAYSYFAGAPPFSFTTVAAPAICPALGSETATVTGGTAPYSYQWFDLSTMATVGTTNPISLPAGGYGLTVTDAAGCTFGSLVTMDSVAPVYSIAPFSVPVSTTVASCTNGTATAGPITGGTPPYTYLWSNGSTAASISGLVMGSYSCVVTDAGGCSATGYGYVSQSITITVPTTPTPATCLASDGAIIGFGSGGLPPYTYLWSNGATTQAQTGLTSGSYNVTVTDANGCIGYGSGYISAATPITVTYTSTTSLCTSATGTAHIVPTGGTAPYTINWYTAPPQTGATATSLAPGTYGFHVTDAVGCVRSGSVPVAPFETILESHTTTSALCTLANGAITVVPSGGTTPYTYSWSTGATTSGISSVPAGGYNVTITDAAGCHISKHLIVPGYSPVGVGLSSTPASCIFSNDGAMSATPTGGTSPYSYSWSTGGTGSSISSLLTGYYGVYVTDALGCTAHNSTWLPYNPGTSCYCTISGTVYNDINNNCIQDPGENGIPNIQIYCSGRGYTYTDLAGHYSFQVPSGSYTITETVMTFYPLAGCQTNNIPVTAVAGTGCVHTVDFANNTATIHDTHISTWDYTMPIPGNTYTQLTVVSNDGTVNESTILSGYKPDGQLFAPSFTPSGIFTGAPYWYNTAPGFPLLNPGYTQPFLIDYAVPTFIPLGTSVLFKDSVACAAPMSTWLTDYTPWNNTNYFNTTVVSSYDPNFKEVSPKGVGTAGTITYADSVLEYMVHFQNTGTAPAQNIVVVDTLDNNLDWTTLRPVYQSAKCKVTLEQSGTYKIAKFIFNDINLPAESTNAITSNGALTYTIKTRHGLPVGTTFKNRAAIYFDYNAPVITNTTLNTLGSTLATSNVPSAPQASFSVYPNPAARSFSAIINSTEAGSATLSISDVTGKTLITKTVEMQKGYQSVSNDVTDLTPGIYFVTLLQNGQAQTQKLVIMK